MTYDAVHVPYGETVLAKNTWVHFTKFSMA